MKIGLVGLGRMGAAIAQRLRANGFEVMAWDRRAEAAQAAAKDIAIAENPKAIAAACDIIISIITEDHGVREVFNGPQGFLSADVKGKLFIDRVEGSDFHFHHFNDTKWVAISIYYNRDITYFRKWLATIFQTP